MEVQTLYLIMALAGMVILVLSIFGGDADGLDLEVGDVDFDISDAEVGNDSVSLFSIRTLSTFLLGFGIAGWLTVKGEYTLTVQLITGFLSAFLITLLYFFVMKGMYSMQGSSMVSSIDMIGKRGVINVPTTSTGIAQMKINTNAGFHEYTVKEHENKKLNQNDLVEVISDLGGGNLLVKKI
jgi:membrane protein implicated in regulation of membrane protease activity